jgi:hypothetical protein
MDQKVLLETILSEKVLDKYRSRDLQLDDLITDLEKSLDRWQSIKNIYVSNQIVRASKIVSIFQRRLATIPKESLESTFDEQIQVRELKNATAQFVDFLKSNPLADIATVIFNCDKFHYDVKCGILHKEFRVICVFKGKPIPEELLQDSDAP